MGARAVRVQRLPNPTSESGIRVRHPSQTSESDIRVRHPNPTSESDIRARHPSQTSESGIQVPSIARAEGSQACDRTRSGSRFGYDRKPCRTDGAGQWSPPFTSGGVRGGWERERAHYPPKVYSQYNGENLSLRPCLLSGASLLSMRFLFWVVICTVGWEEVMQIIKGK